jgi:hypothetical protein
MAIDYRVTVFIPDEVLNHYWEDGLKVGLKMLSFEGNIEDVYCGNWVVEFDQYNKAVNAEIELENLVERYTKSYEQLLASAKEMTIAEIEEKLGHPIKIVK